MAKKKAAKKVVRVKKAKKVAKVKKAVKVRADKETRVPVAFRLVEAIVAMTEVNVLPPVPMDKEFEEDWMSECGKMTGDFWVQPGEKEEACEVRLKDGTVVGPCCLDGKNYVRVDGEKDIPGERVVKVRYYAEAPEFEEEEEREEEASEELDAVMNLMQKEMEDES